MLAAGFGLAMHLALPLAAAAQTPPAPSATDNAEDADEATEEMAPATDAPAADAPAADANADIMKDIDESKLDWSQLNTDSTSLPTLAPKGGARPVGTASNDPAWSSNNNANGTSAVSVKQQLSPFLDTRIGADMTVARQGTLTTSEQMSERLANGGSLPQSGGSAWAAVSAPGVASVWDKTSVEARVDPGAEQSKIGTSLSKQVPLSDDYSLSLKNGYTVTEQGTVMPVPGVISRTTRSYDTEQSASLSVNDTGTSITAGQTSSFDNRWLRRVGAEQKLLDGVTVSGSVGETSQGTINKSISAGFKRSW